MQPRQQQQEGEENNRLCSRRRADLVAKRKMSTLPESSECGDGTLTPPRLLTPAPLWCRFWSRWLFLPLCGCAFYVFIFFLHHLFFNACPCSWRGHGFFQRLGHHAARGGHLATLWRGV